MAFARNQWYVTAYRNEVGRDLLARTVLGEPLVLYRTESGEAVALADRCVHRRYPLSESRLDGDTIVCGYHGFTYDQASTRPPRARTATPSTPRSCTPSRRRRSTPPTTSGRSPATSPSTTSR
ncbi:Rieske 2Fe-2S domain-containing protein [Verrucosispora sp. WMMD573]|uniref:Rieske 2Fe-2S domain-containing protein n=1 Tax=Verrucosispora sp. WMMD573 TaxID=3015149 RepID=UPI00248CB076|nr:Rieske 2Fe-2S domain-containing protein [Verrucosispora sp. WMMD573]WBB52951.1 Rieske 2Fe-2S domain-containing protein [Verrucosispora sp. WMMD573]